MPQLQHELWQLGLLILCVPLQFILVQQWGHNESSRSYALNGLFSSLQKFKSEYLIWDSWKRWCNQLLSRLKEEPENKSPSNLYDVDLDNPLGESPAVEVFQYKNKDGFFATSPEPRNPRLPTIKYRVGQVIVHKIWKYKGVIIGWDEIAKAPKQWLQEMHGNKNPHWLQMPNYAVLVDTRDRMTPQMTYIPEENIEIIKNTRIMHPILEDYFETFDGEQYIPRPWLKAVYPHD
ncbi:uncharacterized protein LOC143223760 [Tachypleus tridentatus]|uniref:uncharacterized protein LOC143223760 n=1 Tax=Tachypleus tridentatus TaxID=6853 RepID=UPI003FD3FF03